MAMSGAYLLAVAHGPRLLMLSVGDLQGLTLLLRCQTVGSTMPYADGALLGYTTYLFWYEHDYLGQSLLAMSGDQLGLTRKTGN